uniref:Uncharacterized protein n=1 Tax=Xiphophorus couchianus TaxID=32473 RepID=A0A3B5MS95_9TELE
TLTVTAKRGFDTTKTQRIASHSHVKGLGLDEAGNAKQTIVFMSFSPWKEKSELTYKTQQMGMSIGPLKSD